MSKSRKKTKSTGIRPVTAVVSYDHVLSDMVDLLNSARRTAARTVNAVMTATYWEIGRRIVELEQGGLVKAGYGEMILKKLAVDLTRRLGRGFSLTNLKQFRKFYASFGVHTKGQTVSDLLAGTPQDQKGQTPSDQLPSPEECETFQTISGKTSGRSPNGRGEIVQSVSAQSHLSILTAIGQRFPLPWSHYVCLLAVDDPAAREFYEAEALRCGWSVRQLDRQIATLFYERTSLSRNKAAMLQKGAKPLPEDFVSPEQEIKDPFVLEFLDLKDEYSETELEESLVSNLQQFLLELGGDFTFVARQRRLRVGDEWYRIDLLFFHRRLRCLVVIDLKVGKFTHADAGQMHLYLNYAREHWVLPDENPPVGLILCAQKDAAVAKYALEGLPNKVLAAQYKLALPSAEIIADEITRTRKMLESRLPSPKGAAKK